MPTGKVKWFDPDKGYGFLTSDDGDKDVFVHIRAVEAAGMSDLVPNQELSFELETGKNGKQHAAKLQQL